MHRDGVSPDLCNLDTTALAPAGQTLQQTLQEGHGISTGAGHGADGVTESHTTAIHVGNHLAEAQGGSRR